MRVVGLTKDVMLSSHEIFRDLKDYPVLTYFVTALTIELK